MTKRVNEVLSIMEDYFTNYLPFVKGLSSNTIKSYQYAFQLLFKYLEAEKNISPEQISFQALSGDTIPDFLLYLEQERGCSIHTRNLRRSAIVSFAKFASKKAFVSSLSFYTDVIDLPVKRQPKQLGVKYFTKDEIAASVDAVPSKLYFFAAGVSVPDGSPDTSANDTPGTDPTTIQAVMSAAITRFFIPRFFISLFLLL